MRTGKHRKSRNIKWLTAIVLPLAIAAALVPNLASAASTDAAPSVPSGFTSTTIDRLLDTRVGSHALPSESSTTVQVTGRDGVPADATAAVLNVTAVGGAQGGVASVFPNGTARTTTSAINWSAGQVIANQLIVPLGSDGAVTVFNHSDSPTNFVVDLYGYQAALPAPTNTLAGAYESVASYDVGDTNGGAIATVACKNSTDVAISGGVQELGLGTNDLSVDVPVADSFAGRMNFATNTPKPGDLSGWTVRFGSQTGAAPKFVKIFAVCVPNLNLPIEQTFVESAG